MYTAIVVAGGVGNRAGFPHNKVLHEIHGKPLVAYALEAFNADSDCAEVVLVAHRDDLGVMALRFSDLVDDVVPGGVTRQDSVMSGLERARSDMVIVHDGARPFVPVLEPLKQAALTHGAATFAIPVNETVKRVVEDVVIDDVDRTNLMLVQTPQAFMRTLLVEAYERVADRVFTCEAGLVTSVLHHPVKVVLGDRRNVKLTTPDDVVLLACVLS